MRLLQNLSIKNKLVCVILVVSIFSLVIGFTFVIFNSVATFKRVMAETTSVNAKLMGEYCIVPLEFQYHAGAKEVLEKLQTLPDIILGIVYDAQGNIFAAYGDISGAENLPTEVVAGESSFFKRRYLHVFQPITLESKIIGTIYLKASNASLKKQTHKYLVTMGFLSLAILALTYFLALRLQGFVSKPILNLAQVTNTISKHANYSLRVQKAGDDEIGILYDGFNEMLEKIQQREHERDRATKTLRERTDELSETLKDLNSAQSKLIQAGKMAAIGKLAAGVTHEINNPIGAITSAADNSKRCILKINQVLEKSDNLDQIRKSDLYQKSVKILKTNNEVITVASRRISKIIKSLRNFTRIDESDLQLANLHEGIESTLTLIQNEIKDRIRIIKIFDDIPAILCYPGQLNQVLMSLLLNSAQAIEKQGTITISTVAQFSAGDSSEASHVTIKISDTGKGISQDKLHSIFEMGFSTKKARMGMGLGLPTVYNIIQKHNGKIEVKSRLGEGTIFTITLPVSQDISKLQADS